jgi:TfoX/Sxy family transcriptional regulator of competence genes
MSYDEKLADRVRKVLVKQRGVIEKEMFGGLAFLLEGRMFVGVLKRELMVRVGPKEHGKALEKPFARPMDFTGKPLTGYVFVSPAGVETARALGAWVAKGQKFVALLARPQKKRPRAKKKNTPKPRRRTRPKAKR